MLFLAFLSHKESNYAIIMVIIMYAFQCHHILLKLAYQIIISSIIINVRESYVASKTKSLYYAVQ